MEIELAHTQGFCAGVAMAIDVVEEALRKSLLFLNSFTISELFSIL